MTFIPISALAGDNVVERSGLMPWYDGPTLLRHLETVDVGTGGGRAGRPTPVRLPVQYVIRPHRADYPDYRGYAGTVATGELRPGDEVVVLPAGTSHHGAGHRDRRRPRRPGGRRAGRDGPARRRRRRVAR